jgi:autotransporter-associated beta strand protein
MIRSFRTSLLVLPLLLASIVPPAVQAIESQESAVSWRTQSDDFIDGGFSSGFELFYAGPEWFLNALSNPRSRNPFVKSFLDDSAGDRLGVENGYVGTLRDVFDVGLFGNIATFSGGGSGKASTTTLALPILLGTVYTYNSSSSSVWLNTSNWSSSNAGHWPGVTAQSNAGSGATTITINFSSGSGSANQLLTLGSIDLLSNAASNVVVQNSSTLLDGTLALTSTTINSIDNTVLSNEGAKNLTLQNGSSKNMDVRLDGANNIIQINGAGNISISSLIKSGSGSNLELTGAGSGSLTLSGSNTYTGTTTITQGTLSASNIAVSGGSSNLGNATSAVILGGTSTSGTLNYTGAADTYTRGFTVNAGGGKIINAGTGLLTIGTGNITDGGTLTFSAANANGITVNSLISSTGGVTINSTGGGTVTLTANNSYAGLTTLTAGTLTLSGANTGSGGVTLTAGTLNINNAGTSATNSSLGTGLFTINGGTIDNTSAGAFTLATNNTQTWGGNFAFTGTKDLNLGTGAVTLSGTRTVTVNGGNLTVGGAIGDSGSTFGVTKAGVGTLTLTGGNTYTGTTTINAGTLQISGGSAIADTGLVTLGTSTANTFDVQTSEIIGALGGGNASIGVVNLASGKTLTLSSGTQTYSGTFSGTGTLKIDGANETIASAVTLDTVNLTSGALTLSSANTITNGLTISGGILNIGNDNALGTGTLTINGGTLQAASSTARAPTVTQINVGGDFTIGGTNTGALSFSAPVDLGGATRQVTDNNTTNSTTFSGIISNGGLTKLGNGQLNLAGTSSNTYTGLTTVTAGTLGLGKSASINAFGGDLTINGGAVVYSAANDNQIIDSAKVTISSGTLTFGARNETIGETATPASGLALSGTGAITISSGTVQIANSMSMTGGTVTLTGAGAFQANTEFNFSGGTIDFTGAGALNLRGGTGTGITYSSSGTTTAQITNSSGTGSVSLNTAASATTVFNIADAPTVATEMVIAVPITGLGKNLQKTGAGVLVLSGANTYTGTTTITNGTLQLGNAGTTGSLSTSSTIVDNANFTIKRSNTVTQGTDFSGAAITGSGSFTQAGTGTTVLTANTYSGGTTVNDGLLQLNSSTALGSTSGSLTVNAASGNAAILDLNGNSISVGNLTGTGGNIWNNGPNAGSSTVTLTIGTGNTGGGNYQGVISNNNGAAPLAKIALTKTGTGTITLSGANTYTGATTVNGGGTLFINGDQTAATGATTVTGAGTVLGGTGTIGGNVTVGGSNTATIIEGGTGSTGQTLTVKGSLTMQSGSIIELALGASAAHSTLALTAAGSSSFYLTQQFSFIDLGAQTATTYNGIITGVTSAVVTTGWTIDNPGWSGAFVWDAANSEIDLTLTAIPEPSTWIGAALALGAIGLMSRKRFAKRSRVIS